MTTLADQRAARNGHRADCPLDHIAPPFASCACHLPENTPMTDERKALEEVFKQIFGMGPYRLKDRGDEAQERIAYRFIAMLDCGAYLDAAMMLVPERCWIRMDDWPRDMVHGAVASVCPLVKVADNPVYSATGDTMALALLGAIREAGKNDA